MNPYLACLVVVVSIGASVVWSDRRNLVSQALALSAFCAAVWIFLLWAIRAPWIGNPVPWLRAAVAVGDIFPWLLWWTGRCAIQPRGSWRDLFSEGRYWMTASLLLASLALSPWFLPPEASPSHHVFGPGYVPHQIAHLLLFLTLLVHAVLEISRLMGFARSMAKLFFIGGGVTALLSAALMVSKHFGYPQLVRGAPVVASIFYVIGAWAVSSQQLLDARHHLLTVLRRSMALIGAAFVITTLMERPSILPRELHVLISATSGVVLALVFDSLSGFALDRSLAKGSLAAARALQRFATNIAALPAAELRESSAQRLAETLSCREVAVFWRSAADRPLHLVSAHHTPPDCPVTLGDDHALLRHSMQERAPWWLARRLPAVDHSLAGFALCVPVIERGNVLLLVLTGHKSSAMGFTQSEFSALQAWALSCHHTLTTRALIEREHAQQQLVYAGKLAAGIAHNLRNPLAIVRAYVEADSAIERSHLTELHDLALTETSRIQSTIDSLTALSRGERFALVSHDLDALVRRAVELNASYLAECRATVEIVSAPRHPRALVEPWQLTTALTNLLRNSAEEVAREGGGEIRLELQPVASAWVAIRLRDSGRGLPPHIRDAVFSRDLFAQTTKATASSTRRTGFGIGLHSTMLIVTIGHGGQFEYRDGAFVITLPAAPAASAPGGE
ncbi:MAG: hypothetical protein HYV96_17695 [Opitutae bacterium]|nr:hypothetical protein [Opitutae bacterium]